MIEKLFEFFPDGALAINRDGLICHANNQCLSLFGYQKEQLVGQPIDILIPANRNQHQRYVKEYFEKPVLRKINPALNIEGLCSDGRCITLEITISHIPDDDSPMAIACIRDLSGVREKEREIVLHAEEYRSIIDHMPVIVFRGTFRGSHPISFINDSSQDILGFSATDILEGAFDWTERISAGHQRILRREMVKALRNGQDFHFAFQIRRADGSPCWLDVRGRRRRYDSGPDLLEGVATDITLQRFAEQELYNKERLLTMAESVSKVGHWHYDVGSDRLHWSDEVYRIHGLLPQSFKPTIEQALSFYHKDDRKRIREIAANAIEKCKPFRFHARLSDANERLRKVYSAGHVLADAAGKVIRVFGIVEDQTDKIDSEKERIRFASLAQHIDGAIALLDHKGHISWMNAKCQKYFCCGDECIGTAFRDLVASNVAEVQDISSHIALRKGAGHFQLKMPNNKKVRGLDIALSSYHVGGEFGFVLVANDITDKLEYEKYLNQTQKMQAVGQMVGGIAHDFNNMIAVVQGNLELIGLKSGEAVPGLARPLKNALAATDRASSLTKKLLRFSRQAPSQNESVDINDVVRHMYDMLQKSITAGISIRLELTSPTSVCMVNKGDLEDALVNLVLNASDAMEGQGAVRILTKNIEVTSRRVMLDGSVIEPGKYVQLSISDQGGGIAPDILPRIFDPFFTTKGAEGTGLGLSMVYGFIKRSEGYIDIRSNEYGTTFFLILPAIDSKAEPISQGPVSQGVEQESRSTPGREDTAVDAHALIVDDEPFILDILSEALDSMDISYQTASSADQAWELLLGADSRYSLVLSDVIMPGQMNGIDLAKNIQSRFPAMRVGLITGYSGRTKAPADIPLLEKPFTIAQLRTFISQVCNSG
tara:strand:- start:839 stop:3487 length:2649 start_codon:yes stop_codon:yes gene_type:complete